MEATFLTKFASKVYLIHRREEFRASRIMLDRAAPTKIEFATDTAVDSLLGEDRCRGLVLRDTRTGETRELDVTGMFVAIGHDPRK